MSSSRSATGPRGVPTASRSFRTAGTPGASASSEASSAALSSTCVTRNILGRASTSDVVGIAILFLSPVSTSHGAQQSAATRPRTLVQPKERKVRVKNIRQRHIQLLAVRKSCMHSRSIPRRP